MSQRKRVRSAPSTSAPDEDIGRLFGPHFMANEDTADLRFLPPHIPSELGFEIVKRCDVSTLKSLVRMDENG